MRRDNSFDREGARAGVTRQSTTRVWLAERLPAKLLIRGFTGQSGEAHQLLTQPAEAGTEAENFIARLSF